MTTGWLVNQNMFKDCQKFTSKLIFGVGFLILGCTYRGPPYGAVVGHSPDPERQPYPLTMPNNAPTITQDYGGNDNSEVDTPHLLMFHEGLDFTGKVGDPVLAAAAGTVVQSTRDAAVGNKLVIAHGVNAWGQKVLSLYMHLETKMVKTGDHVQRGAQIGALGATGYLAMRPHLHFEVLNAEPGSGSGQWQTVNPHRYWAGGIGRITCFNKSKHYPSKPFRITCPVLCKK